MVNITTSGVLNGNTSYVYTIKNPLTFIYNATIPYDWYATDAVNQNNALWGANTDKSACDPCPKGWKIPTDAEKTFGDFSIETFPYFVQGSQTSSGNYNAANGRQYNQISWYPACGCRRYLNGALGYAGSNSSYWSTSVSATLVKYMDFNMNGVVPNFAGKRAACISVRCVQE